MADADEDSGRHRLHQAVYELRGTLRGVDPERSPIICAAGGYAVDHEMPVWVDVEEFDELASAAARCFAARQAEQVIKLSRRALDLYRGDFLGQATEADWAAVERNRLAARFVQLSMHLGEILVRRGDCVTRGARAAGMCPATRRWSRPAQERFPEAAAAQSRDPFSGDGAAG